MIDAAVNHDQVEWHVPHVKEINPTRCLVFDADYRYQGSSLNDNYYQVPI